jgi:peroxiredoxin
MRADIVPGAVFPDYELSDHRGKRRTLSELQEGDPLVLVLSRGGFCPKDRRQHEGLLQLHREMTVAWTVQREPPRKCSSRDSRPTSVRS